MSTLLSNTIKPASGDTVTFADCNVSVGGTLTSEDVTSVDSVGLITARSGIEVSGIVTATTYYGDGSNLTGVESGIVNFVASGNIDNGKTVIIKDDGTVGIVTMVSSDTPSGGTPVVFQNSNTLELSTVYDSTNDRIVVFYSDGGASYKGKAVVGTVTGTGITFGPATEFNPSNSFEVNAVSMGGGKVVVTYKDNVKGYAKVGTISPGPSVSFGSSSEFVSGASGFDYSSAGYAGTDTVAIAYRDASNSYHGYVSIGSVDTSANTITFGTPVNIGSFNTEWTSTTYDTWNDKLIVTYRNSGSNDRGEVIAGDVSGVGVTFGPAAPTQFTPSVSGGIVVTSTTFDSTNGKIVIAFRDGATPYPGLAMVGFVTTNNEVSLGSSVEFASATASNNLDNVYDSTNNRVCITYQGTDTYGKAIVGTVSGDTISFGSTGEYASSFTNEQSSAYDSANERVVIAYSDGNNSYYGTSVVLSPTSPVTNLTSENYIGIAAETISDTSTGKVNVIGGVNSGQSGLTTAKTYYVGQSGILTTTADTPSVVAGNSISSTKIKVR